MSDFEKPRTEQEPEAPAPKRRHNWSKTIGISLVCILAVLTLANLDAILRPIESLSKILTPITIGLVIAYIANPFLKFFEYKLFNKVKKRTVNRCLSMLLAYLLLLAIITGILFLIIPAFMASVKDLQANGMLYVNRVLESINNLASDIPFLEKEAVAQFLNLENLLNWLISFLSQAGSKLPSSLISIAGGTFKVLTNIIVGVFISIYVLLTKDRLNAGCRRILRALFSRKNEERLLYYFSKAHNKFGGYLIGKMVDSLMVGILCGILFTVFKIPYAVLIAVIIGVTDFIPFFGPFIGAIPSAVIIFIASPSKAIVFVLLILVVQQIDGNLIAPAILGDRTGLSSLGVIIAITVMSDIFGFGGMIIGVPLFAIIVTMLDDYIAHRLHKKGEDTDINSYYSATAFIRPSDVSEQEITLTQRFMHWVAAIEQDESGKSHPFRGTLLSIGQAFKRVFSVAPIPEDHKGGIFMDIAKHGMKTDRSFMRTLLLSIFSLFIYPFYLIEVIAQSINAAAGRDGKRTWGFLPFLIFSILTLGLYPLFWHCGVIVRMQEYCEENGKKCRISRRFFLCWALIGLPLIIGPFIALARFLSAFNQTCEIYNSTHTFPLSKEEIENELAPIPTPRKPITPFFATDISTLIAEAEAEAEAELEAEAAAAAAALAELEEEDMTEAEGEAKVDSEQDEQSFIPDGENPELDINE